MLIFSKSLIKLIYVITFITIKTHNYYKYQCQKRYKNDAQIIFSELRKSDIQTPFDYSIISKNWILYCSKIKWKITFNYKDYNFFNCWSSSLLAYSIVVLLKLMVIRCRNRIILCNINIRLRRIRNIFVK